MKTIEGQYFDGERPLAAEGRLDIGDADVTLVVGEHTGRYAKSQMRVTPRIGSVLRFINFADGGQFLCADQTYLDALPQESPSEGVVSWLENRIKVAVASVVCIVLFLIGGYFYGLPIIAKKIVQRIPIKTEIALGEQVLSWFDESGWSTPSDLEYLDREEILSGFRRLYADLPYRDHYRLEFRQGNIIGPNAFALPGGIILITDELVQTAETIDEVLAVLAHEIGHIELRHSMRMVIQNSIVAAGAAAVTADAATLSVAVAGLPVVIAQKKYSRGFESEADTFAFRLLRAKGISPEAFATFMERLRGDMEDMPPGLNYLSTHPVTKKRVARARAAAVED